MIELSPEQIEALYGCISLAMDHRNNIEWESEEQYWSEWDSMTKNIDLALVTTNKLAGYNHA